MDQPVSLRGNDRSIDLELKALGSFIGTLEYHRVLGFRVTDGVTYIMENGYSWFVTDALAVIGWYKGGVLRNQPFLTVELHQADGEADLIITDGNDHELYRQHYDYTDAKRNLTLYYEHGVLLLDREH